MHKDLINQDATSVTDTFIAGPKASDLVHRKVRVRQVDEQGKSHGVGRYKTAVARAFLYAGAPDFEINGRKLADYFQRLLYRQDVQKPLVLTGTQGTMTGYATVKGGGLTAQSRAIRLAIAVALEKYNPTFYDVLREHKLTTFVNKRKEREKPGQKGARAKKPTSRR